MKKVAKTKVGKINLTGFVIVTSIVTTDRHNRTEFWTTHTTCNSTWAETYSDVRSAKVFKSEKAAQKFLDNYIERTGHDIDVHVVVPISNYIVTGYRLKNGKAVKVKCFEGFYSLEGKKDRSGFYYNTYTVYKTAAECIREEIGNAKRDIKDEIRGVKEEIKHSTKELKDLEKQLKKLSAGV